MSCPGCGTPLPESALSCPECRRFIHADKLSDLAGRAKEAWRLGRFAEERTLWTESLILLPEDTVQHRSVATRLAEIDEMLGNAAHAQRKTSAAGVGPLLALLILGLTKGTTLLTMFASFGVYWGIYGWPLAAGLVISIYIHEMGHMAMIHRYGLPASVPMFIPGFGALIRLRGRNLPPIVDCRIGLAGPIYGLGAALAALAIYYFTRVRIFGVIANFGGMINLLNLIPVWQLDGARGMHSLTRSQRGAVAGVAITLAAFTRSGLLLVIGLVCLCRLFTPDFQKEPDKEGLIQYLLLLGALSVVVLLSNASTVK